MGAWLMCSPIWELWLPSFLEIGLTSRQSKVRPVGWYVGLSVRTLALRTQVSKTAKTWAPRIRRRCSLKDRGAAACRERPLSTFVGARATCMQIGEGSDAGLERLGVGGSGPQLIQNRMFSRHSKSFDLNTLRGITYPIENRAFSVLSKCRVLNTLV